MSARYRADTLVCPRCEAPIDSAFDDEVCPECGELLRARTRHGRASVDDEENLSYEHDDSDEYNDYADNDSEDYSDDDYSYDRYGGSDYDDDRE